MRQSLNAIYGQEALALLYDVRNKDYHDLHQHFDYSHSVETRPRNSTLFIESTMSLKPKR